jgi:hypothetical protein
MTEPRQIHQVRDASFLAHPLHIQLREVQQWKAETPEHCLLSCSGSGRIDAKRWARVR